MQNASPLASFLALSLFSLLRRKRLGPLAVEAVNDFNVLGAYVVKPTVVREPAVSWKSQRGLHQINDGRPLAQYNAAIFVGVGYTPRALRDNTASKPKKMRGSENKNGITRSRRNTSGENLGFCTDPGSFQGDRRIERAIGSEFAIVQLRVAYLRNPETDSEEHEEDDEVK